MPRGSSNGRRKRNLLAQDPHCWWCGREVFDYQDGSWHDDEATIDHLYDRNFFKPRPPEGITLLACAQCNRDRGTASQQAAQQLAPRSACQECGKDCTDRFCSRDCWQDNLARFPWRRHKKKA